MLNIIKVECTEKIEGFPSNVYITSEHPIYFSINESSNPAFCYLTLHIALLWSATGFLHSCDNTMKKKDAEITVINFLNWINGYSDTTCGTFGNLKFTKMGG